MMEQNWNIVGVPYDEIVYKNSLVVQYNGNDYSWYEATTSNNEEGEPLILGFIYGWSNNSQSYSLSDRFDPGQGYWMFAFYDCVLKREMS